MRIYIDGTLVATGTQAAIRQNVTPTWNRNPASFSIGASRDTGYANTDGNIKLAQGQIYSDTVLSAANIVLLAETCPWTDLNPTTHWILNGAADLIDHSVAGGSQNLAIVGHATTEAQCPCPGEEEPPPGGGSPPEPPPEEGSPPNPNPDPPPEQGSPGSPPTGGPSLPGPPNCCYEPNPPGPDNPNPPGPAPGGNPGGNGWEPQCEGGGTVGSYPVADPGESMVGVRDPRLSLEVQWQAFDAENVVTEIPAYWSVDQSMPDPPDYYGGRKDGRLFGISRITRGLSDDQGQYVGSSVDVSLNDKDRAALRTRLGSDTDKYVWEREGIIRIVSEAGRRARVDQRELFRGVSRGINLSSGFKGSIRFEDQLTTQIGKFGPDRTFSTRTFTTGLCAAKDLVGKPMQWIFGGR